MRTLAGRKEAVDRGVEHLEESRVDSAAVRWVFAATVAFWLVVYAAGRALF